ncbi:unnamed protein product, partial [Mesorhabditis spiculigera]
MNGCIQALALIFAFAQIVADELETSTTDIPIINVADRGDEANTLWCPTASIGNKCPEPDLFSYNKCCGPTNKDCCSHLRVSIVVLPVACLLPFVTMLLYRFCCRPPPSGYTPGVRQNPTVSFQAANSSINVPSQTSQANEPSTL